MSSFSMNVFLSEEKQTLFWAKLFETVNLLVKLITINEYQQQRSSMPMVRVFINGLYIYYTDRDLGSGNWMGLQIIIYKVIDFSYRF